MIRLRLSLLLLLAALALSGCADSRVRAEEPAADMTVRRGSLRSRMLLTGELAADRALELKVPRTRTAQLQVRWMERDGALVEVGQPVVELDNSNFTADLEEKRLQASEAADELARKQAEAASTLEEKRFLVEKYRNELEKARLRATVPEGVLALREVQERQLEVRRAETDMAKAETDLEAWRQESAADLKIQRIALEQARREIREAERAIEILTFRAPRSGMVLVGEQPWEGRKLQEGDVVWTGMTVVSLPDLASLVVQAELSDVDDRRIAVGQEVVCVMDAYPSERFRGRVAEIAPVAREDESGSLRRHFPVRVLLDRLDRRMRPGMSVRVEVLGAEARGLIVPRAALDVSAGSPRVLLEGGGAVPVRLGPCTANECVVEGGLSEGARLRPHPLAPSPISLPPDPGRGGTPAKRIAETQQGASATVPLSRWGPAAGPAEGRDGRWERGPGGEVS